MASAFAFQPTGPAILVDNTARQIGAGASTGAIGMRSSNAYRVLNLAAAVQYFTTGPTNAVASAGAPVAATPSQNTIGMAAGEAKTFTGLGDWMIASSATGFVVVPGDGV